MIFRKGYSRMRPRNQKNHLEKRQYVRLESSYPVEYAIVDPQSNHEELNWQQGFTCNVSDGGICLSLNKIDVSLVSHRTQKKFHLKLRVRIPLYAPPLEATASIAWIDRIEDAIPSRYLIGLKFTEVSQGDVRRMMNHIRWVRFTIPVVMVLACAFFVAFVASSFYNARLRHANQALIQRLVNIQGEETRTDRILGDVIRKKEELSVKIENYAQEIASFKKQTAVLKQALDDKEEKENVLAGQLSDDESQVALLNDRIERLAGEKEPLETQLDSLVQRENILKDEVLILKRKKEGLQKTVLNKMYLWLKTHQIPATGLVISFEGEVGPVQHWSFTYDQALAVNAFLLFNDIDNSRKILDFFKRNLAGDPGGFHNAYYADSGEIAEYTIHSGPNIWLGIAALQYTIKTQDERYLPLALRIGEWLMALQKEDPAGGVRGGPEVSWFATEHNLDAYAFLKMLYQVTGQDQYRAAQEKVLIWLKTYAMSPHGQEYKVPPVQRGRGDATIATDTFAWSLAAIGAEDLIHMGMDPEQIMSFAEKHCEATVPFKRPSGAEVEVTGFDFAAYRHMPRGGLVSPEWTSQMIISFQMLSDFFADQGDRLKSGYYQEKVVKYLNEMNKLIISSPSYMGHGEGCLPYATLQEADTGHGWKTPRGTDTCSIAGTAYMIMALREFNPLTLENLSYVPGN